MRLECADDSKCGFVELAPEHVLSTPEFRAWLMGVEGVADVKDSPTSKRCTGSAMHAPQALLTTECEKGLMIAVAHDDDGV
jgi:hypothetical protein